MSHLVPTPQELTSGGQASSSSQSPLPLEYQAEDEAGIAPVLTLGSTILSNASDLERRLSSFRVSDAKKRLSLRSLFTLRSERNDHLRSALEASLINLKNIETYIQSLVLACEIHQDDSSFATAPELEVHLTGLSETLNRLRAVLDSNPRSLSQLVDGVGAFNSTTQGWVSTVQRLMIARQGQDIQHPMEDESETFQNHGVELCPLENIMLTHMNLARSKTYPLRAFIEWAWHEGEFSALHSQIGSVRTVTLYRQEGALHHEYALFCFGADGGRESWIRVERAAELKARWYLPRGDSVGPIFGGARLKESVSFASSGDALRFFPDRRIASIALQTGPNTSRMLLYEVAFQLRELPERSEHYRLLTENCRWFARRNLLTVVDRLDAIHLGYRTVWLDQEVPVRVLREKLADEQFGGKQTGGDKGAHLKARSLVDLAWRLICDGRHTEGVSLCFEALQVLDEDKSDLPRHRYLESGVWNSLGVAYRDLRRLPEALDATNKGCHISAVLRSEDLKYESLYFVTHNSLASILLLMGRNQEAVKITEELVEIRRGIWRKTSDMESADLLSQALLRHSHALSASPALKEEQMRVIEENVALQRNMNGQRPDLYRNGLGNALSTYATALNQAGRVEEALSLSLESIDIRRVLMTSHAHFVGPKLAVELSHAAWYSMMLSKWEDACAMGEESIGLLQPLSERGPDAYRPLLAVTAYRLGLSYLSVGKITEGFNSWCDALPLYRALFSASPAEYQIILARLLEAVADLNDELLALPKLRSDQEVTLDSQSLRLEARSLEPVVA